MTASRIPRAAAAAPALPLAIGVLGGGAAASTLGFWMVRTSPAWQARWPLIVLAGAALAIGATIAATVAALSLLRARRTLGGGLAAAGFAISALVLVLQLIAAWMWPWEDAARGWRALVLDEGSWVRFAAPVVATLGLCAAAWADRAVRVLAPVAVGAAMMAIPPPPVVSWAYAWFEHPTWVWDADLGQYVQQADQRLWIVPGAIAVGSLGWGLTAALLALRQPGVPADAIAPRPPASALRRLAVALLVTAGVAVAAGVAIALAQGRPLDGRGWLTVAIPSMVALASAAVAAALLAVAITDVSPRASRRLTAAAILVLWCVAVVVAQTLSSHGPRPDNPMFTIFEAPWMPGMVGAAVAAVALLGIAVALVEIERQAELPLHRGQLLVVILALVFGAATAPWVLGFGTRRLPLDGLRIATLASAAVVNLAAWVALARHAWRVARALDARAADTDTAPTSAYSRDIGGDVPG
jgi:hypothetical protein